jgi:ankyrin repeat protein
MWEEGGRDEPGRTPLHRAVLSGDGDRVRALLSAGADPNARGPAGRPPNGTGPIWSRPSLRPGPTPT